MASKFIKVKIEREKRKKNPETAPWKFTVFGKNGLKLVSQRNYNRSENAKHTVDMLKREFATAEVEIVHPKKKVVKKKSRPVKRKKK